MAVTSPEPIYLRTWFGWAYNWGSFYPEVLTTGMKKLLEMSLKNDFDTLIRDINSDQTIRSALRLQSYSFAMFYLKYNIL